MTLAEPGQGGGGPGRVGGEVRGHGAPRQETKDTQIKSEFIFANRGKFPNI